MLTALAAIVRGSNPAMQHADVARCDRAFLFSMSMLSMPMRRHRRETATHGRRGFSSNGICDSTCD